MWLFVMIGKTILIVLCLFALLLIYQLIRYKNVMARIREMKAKHPDYFTILPNTELFYFGYLANFAEYQKEFDASEEPIILTNQWIHEKMGRDKGTEFNAAEMPVTVTQSFHSLTYFVNDPVVAGDLYTNKNHLIDKAGETEMLFQDMLGKSFLFSKGD